MRTLRRTKSPGENRLHADPYRVILFTIDSESFVEADEVLLLNGFMMKSTKDYKAQIQIAENILSELAK